MKILIIDDHAMIRTGIRQLWEDRNAIMLEADNGRTALTLAAAERPNLIVLDLNLPGVSGLELLRQLLERDPAARLLYLSLPGAPVYAASALKIGAKGYVHKNASPEELRVALQRVAAGLTYVENEIAQHLATLSGEQRQQLTDRDLEILRLLGEGRSFTEIAAALGLGYKTVANTCGQIKAKLGAPRTADLVRIAIQRGITQG